MLRLLLTLTCVAVIAHAQEVGSSYATLDGRAGTIILACPSEDGSFTALACSFEKPSAVTYSGPMTAAVASPNVAVVVFPAGSISAGCDIVNTGTAVLYIDLAATAFAGSSTSIPLQPNQSFHCPFPPLGPVTAVASAPQPFVAVRY